MKTLFTYIVLGLVIAVLLFLVNHYKTEADRQQSNYVAALQMYRKEAQRPVELSPREFRQYFSELADSIENVTDTKLKNMESLIMGSIRVQGDDIAAPVVHDTITVRDTVYTGKSVNVTTECLNQTIFVPDSLDTAFVDFDLKLKAFAYFHKVRQDKYGKERKWPFGKRVSMGSLKVLCGETAVQDSVFVVKFR